MLTVSFDYNLKGLPVVIFATCKCITDSEEIEGLTITFFDENDIRLKVPYDKELFEDIEAEAIHHLGLAYYNPELVFNH